MNPVPKMSIDDLRDRRVAVLGLSVEGLSTAKFLVRKGIHFTALDQKSEDRVDQETVSLIRQSGNGLITGSRYLDRLSAFNFIIRTPGFPLWNPALIAVQKKDTEVSSQTKLFFDLCPCPIIGVTGTKGKGTTSKLIFEMLKSSGYDAFLGGNIGDPPLDFLDGLRTSSVVVLELSSFQLEDLTKSPQMAVVLMITQEHLDSQSKESPNYHRSLVDYLEAKKNIARFQKKDDWAIINYDFENSRSFSKETTAQVLFFSTQGPVENGAYLQGDNLVFCAHQSCQKIVNRREVFLRGEHNLQNVLAASLASLSFGAKMTAAAEVVKTFRGLEHRLEFVREVDEIKFYNDSFSTTPETAVAAIRSFSEPEVVILGGSEKGSDYRSLGRSVVQAHNLKALILIGLTAPKIKAAIAEAGGFKGQIVEGLKSMAEIVGCAKSIAKSGEVVLLSPACASFDMFKNYKDRGEQFKSEVNRL